MRTSMTVAACIAIASLAACGGSDDAKTAGKQAPTVYFGWLLGAAEPTGVAIETDAPVERGPTKLRAYVCDGQGPPRGRAVWFSGRLDAAATARDASVSLTSAGGDETLEIDNASHRLVKGDVTDASGRSRQFVAYPARDGAGIYEVTLDERLRYSGVSTDGSKLTAQAERSGDVTGKITTVEGETIDFTIRTLSLATPADLRARGLSTAYRRDARRSLIPGEYVAVVAPGGTHWLGRSGNVRKGSPGAAIIGLDKKD